MSQIDFLEALPKLFEKSVSLAFKDCDANSEWKLVKVEKNSVDIQDEEAIFLTISSHLFRIFISLHFAINDNIKTFISSSIKETKGVLSDDVINDYLCEVGNSICGGFKRELGKSIPALGMSTPNVLEKGCFVYMDSLDIEREQCFLIKYNGVDLFTANYYLSEHGNLDFDVEVNLENSEAGELEFF